MAFEVRNPSAPRQEAGGRDDVNALFLVNFSVLLSSNALRKPPFPRARRTRPQVELNCYTITLYLPHIHSVYVGDVYTFA